jgi:hypothetical protein
MNWRTITGLILLIVGIRVYYIAAHGVGQTAGNSRLASFVWIAVGVFLIVRGMTRKES